MKTNCVGCCFLRQDTKGIGCYANQYCVISGDKIYTPGFCRLKRTKKWKSEELNNQSLIALARQEIDLKFDLMMIFDECIHEKEDIEKTIETEWMDNRCQQIIVCDITGERVSNKHSLEFFNNYQGEIPLKLDCSVNAENPVRSIRRMVNNCSSKYFLVLPAGKFLSNIRYLANIIKNNDHRNILWMFPQLYGNTIINLRGNTIFSLYHREAFKSLTDHCVEDCIQDEQPCKCESFFDCLKRIEKQTESTIFLSHTVDNCVII